MFLCTGGWLLLTGSALLGLFPSAIIACVWLFVTPDAYKHDAEFPCLLESPGLVFVKFPGPGKSWNLLVSDADGECSGADADAKIYASTRLYSIQHIWIPQLLFTVHLGKRVQLCVVHACTICSTTLKCSIGLTMGSWKNASGVLESPAIFGKQDSGNPDDGANTLAVTCCKSMYLFVVIFTNLIIKM